MLILTYINSYIKYLYYLLGIVLFVLIIILLVKLNNINKQYQIALIGIEDIKEKLKIIEEKTEYIKQSMATSWSFFLNVIAIYQIIKYVIKDYKTTKKEKRSLIKSCSKAIMRKPGTIRKFI